MSFSELCVLCVLSGEKRCTTEDTESTENYRTSASRIIPSRIRSSLSLAKVRRIVFRPEPSTKNGAPGMYATPRFTASSIFAVVSTLAIVLAALYILIMYQRTMTRPVTPEVEDTVTTDLSGRERLAMAPLVLLIVALGVFPKPMIDAIEPTVATTMQHVGVTDPEPRVAAEGGR